MNIYQARYDRIVNHFKNISVDGYTESHHIIPRCLGGTDDPDNLVSLPTKAHFLVHLLLTKIYPDNPGLKFALAAFMRDKTGDRILTGAQYEKARLAFTEARKTIKYPSRKGKFVSEETKEKIRQSLKGRKPSAEARKKMSESRIGRKHKPETIEKIRQSNIGLKRSAEARNNISNAVKEWKSQRKRGA